ncbi:hypothetical protein DMH04_55090 [Kibdelosporangium aridum]|uniref:ABC transporter domain-containing protein n=1 Tax=Kibdelosporangium aridum TaxID=2030 RepID=A0A428XX52_KIBAR|nr:hypothetical protein DMH04_55090 [Kibdelosporangium aridum]
MTAYLSPSWAIVSSRAAMTPVDTGNCRRVSMEMHSMQFPGTGMPLARPLSPSVLSAGERQLIALARVYLSPARIVILDEACCHLDLVSEARAEQAFAQRDGTLIVIAHRMSSALRADRVLLMDGTKVLCGTHSELERCSKLYAVMVEWWTSIPTEAEAG